MDFTEDQLALIKKENPQVGLTLEGMEVFAFFSLGQMHKKIVRMTDGFFGNVKTGYFLIEEFNGKTELDFSNPDDWREIEIKSLKYSLTGITEWGEFKDTYQSLKDIKKIELLK